MGCRGCKKRKKQKVINIAEKMAAIEKRNYFVYRNDSGHYNFAPSTPDNKEGKKIIQMVYFNS